MRVMAWAAEHDRGYLALRRATRAAFIMPVLFAFGDKVLKDANVATFAAFGSFALLLLVDFSGPLAGRVQAQASLGAVGACLVVLGTLASRNAWLAAVAMFVVGFAVLFSGSVSSVLASAAPALLLSFILPVSLSGAPSTIPARLLGWALATVASVLAIRFLWPSPVQEPLRPPAVAACRALAARLRSEADYALSKELDDGAVVRHEALRLSAEEAVGTLHRRSSRLRTGRRG